MIFFANHVCESRLSYFDLEGHVKNLGRVGEEEES